jgi:hypothetical protein
MKCEGAGKERASLSSLQAAGWLAPSRDLRPCAQSSIPPSSRSLQLFRSCRVFLAASKQPSLGAPAAECWHLALCCMGCELLL